ncbi:hypothetical protein [uncultured Thiodictyon sp.]|uniref:hypothetical protein n=1 Tax=uncultured Thiodictyon sp. TaxID=1846217 RepID=UPI0025D5ABE0|nr:hypothetical protein [uncultured Thiodictyon sp.]
MAQLEQRRENGVKVGMFVVGTDYTAAEDLAAAGLVLMEMRDRRTRTAKISLIGKIEDLADATGQAL